MKGQHHRLGFEKLQHIGHNLTEGIVWHDKLYSKYYTGNIQHILQFHRRKQS